MMILVYLLEILYLFLLAFVPILALPEQEHAIRSINRQSNQVTLLQYSLRTLEILLQSSYEQRLVFLLH